MNEIDLLKLREKWPDFSQIPPGEVRAFFRLCRDPMLPGREKAIGLLLNPETVDLPGYFVRLASHLAGLRMRIREIPPELLLVFFELIATAGKMPSDPKLAEFFGNVVAKGHRILLPRLFSKRFPAGPFINSIAPRIFLGRGRTFDFRNRWRILKRVLRQANPQNPKTRKNPENLSDSSGCLEITLADLGPLVAATPAGRTNSAWRYTAKHLAAPARPRVPRTASLSFHSVYWGGAGKRKLAFWEHLAKAQQNELDQIESFAHQVSADTGRVVFSWHNASLAAAGGWAFGNFASRFPSNQAYADFARSVMITAQQVRREMDAEALERLFEMRTRRILAPLALQALANLRAANGFETVDRWNEMSNVAGGMVDRSEIEALAAGEKSEWSGSVAPHQQVSLDRVLSWRDQSRNRWAEGFSLLFALALRGREALDAGLISSFVVPWIDKFFISSRRRADLDYLDTLFRLLAGRIEDPLVLFWDDTAHAAAPSLMHALRDLRGRGLPFRGLGIFDPNGSKRSDAARIIRNEYSTNPEILKDVKDREQPLYPKNLLFVLRPLDDTHFTGFFGRVLDSADYNFLRVYDSSWKDNLAFLYSGTRISLLLSVQTEMESVASWISDGRGRYPFGAWFRQKLGRRVLGDFSEPPDTLRQSYAAWANLL